MNIQPDLDDVIRELANEVSSILPIHWPNEDFLSELPRAELTVLHYDPSRITLSGIHQYRASMELSLCYALGIGTYTALRKAQEILDLFPVDRVIQLAGKPRVQVVSSRILVSYVDTETVWRLPVSIQFRALS